eukprot:215636-Rhodomonas_salina.1
MAENAGEYSTPSLPTHALRYVRFLREYEVLGRSMWNAILSICSEVVCRMYTLESNMHNAIGRFAYRDVPKQAPPPVGSVLSHGWGPYFGTSRSLVLPRSRGLRCVALGCAVCCVLRCASTRRRRQRLKSS